MAEPKLWIVVCQEFHIAYGMFRTPQAASQAAIDLTNERSCVYMPVPFAPVEGTELGYEAPKKEGTHVGQYL